MNPIRHLLRHGEWANGELLRCARPLPDDQLDRPFDMGLGSLRRTLLHIYNGEAVWLERWKGISPPWPSEDEAVAIANLADRFTGLYAARAAFLDGLAPHAVDEMQVYRDSKGSLFQATLGDMLIQGLHHSIHHRAQAVNMLRRLGAEAVDVDYMYWARRPVAPPQEAMHERA